MYKILSIIPKQLSFFPDKKEDENLPKDMLEYIPNVFGIEESNNYLDKFIREEHWHQPIRKMYDKEVLTPCLISWHGERQKKPPVPWTPDRIGCG